MEDNLYAKDVQMKRIIAAAKKGRVRYPASKGRGRATSWRSTRHQWIMAKYVLKPFGATEAAAHRHTDTLQQNLTGVAQPEQRLCGTEQASPFRPGSASAWPAHTAPEVAATPQTVLRTPATRAGHHTPSHHQQWVDEAQGHLDRILEQWPLGEYPPCAAAKKEDLQAAAYRS